MYDAILFLVRSHVLIYMGWRDYENCNVTIYNTYLSRMNCVQGVFVSFVMSTSLFSLLTGRMDRKRASYKKYNYIFIQQNIFIFFTNHFYHKFNPINKVHPINKMKYELLKLWLLLMPLCVWEHCSYKTTDYTDTNNYSCVR